MLFRVFTKDFVNKQAHMRSETELKRFYERHDPARVGDVHHMLETNKDDLKSFVEHIMQKYDVTHDRLLIEEKLHEVFKIHDPTKLTTIPELCKEHEGEDVLDFVIGKYNISKKEMEAISNKAEAVITMMDDEVGVWSDKESSEGVDKEESAELIVDVGEDGEKEDPRHGCAHRTTR